MDKEGDTLLDHAVFCVKDAKLYKGVADSKRHGDDSFYYQEISKKLLFEKRMERICLAISKN
ncbi:MAG: hypothetical protein ACR5KV_08165, partial [Wolbachia sp.]